MTQCRRFLLDNGVFERLVDKNTSQERVFHVLQELDLEQTPIFCKPPAIWREYVRLSRPGYQSTNGKERIANASNPPDLSNISKSIFEELIDKYRSLPELSAPELEKAANNFMEQRVSTTIPEARRLAKGLTELSFDNASKDLGFFFAIDEWFYLLRYMSASDFDNLRIVSADVTRTLCDHSLTAPVPLYRYIDSVKEYLLSVHTDFPDFVNQPGARGMILRNSDGMKSLKRKESADCLWVWLSIQGVYTTNGLCPTTVLTMDKRDTERRVQQTIQILAAKLNGKSCIEQMQEHEQLQPGKIIFFDKISGVRLKEPPPINVKSMVEEIIQDALKW